MNLSKNQIEKYSRQIILKEIGGIGQEKLLNSTISVVGLGALGSPVVYYLAAAGVGYLNLIDFDIVESSNLHRQILHQLEDVGKKKTSSAREKIKKINPDCKVEYHNIKIQNQNVIEFLKGSDFVIEGSDNLPTKMLINDTCEYLGIPFTIAGVLRFYGQIMTVDPNQKTLCYRCVFGDVQSTPEGMSCSQAGVIGTLPGVFGCLEANEAIKSVLN
ncbi:MAG: adenylyltransferase, partial [Candidatus Lokiarchaeota archaeon]|nr:adenylyltransferase [Candidatus Lokiarchaeota archaeon]